MPDQDSASSHVQTLWPFPDHRDLYMLAAGVALGLLLSSAILGQFAPDAYDAIFIGGSEQAAQLEQLLGEQEHALRLLRETGVTAAAADELALEHERQAAPLRAQLQLVRAEHANWLAARMNALIIALAVVLVVEVLVGPQRGTAGRDVSVVRPAVHRLVSVRYALLALWIAIAIARPTSLRDVPLLFTAMVIVVALAAGLVPLGKQRVASDE